MRKREADEPRLFDLPLTPAEDEEEPEAAAAAVRVARRGAAPVDGDFVDGEPAGGDFADGDFVDGEPAEPADDAAGALGAVDPARPASGSRGGFGHGSDDDGLPLFPDDLAPETATAPPRRGHPRARSSREPEPAAPPRAAPSDPGPPERFAPQPAPEPPGYPPFDEAAADLRTVRRSPVPAPFSARLTAALADLGVHAAAAGAAWLGAVLLGARLGAGGLAALAVYLLAFSFLYSVVSLAFWGRTPGMTAAGLVSRGAGGGPLTFGETGLRWLAGVLTAAFFGLPLLVALTGRSLGDRLSGSRTYRLR